MSDNEDPSTLAGVGDEVLTTTLVTIVFLAGVLHHLWRTMDFRWIGEWWQARQNPPPPAEQTAVTQRANRSYSDDKCLICLEDIRLPLTTNCGHRFCAECLIKWLQGPARRPTTSCPTCRQHVSALLRNFEPVADDEARRVLMRQINFYNRRYSGEPRPFWEHVRDLPLLLSHLASEFFSLGGLMYMFRIRIAVCFFLALVYLLSPVDVVPEAMFGLLGFLDDLFVLIVLGVYMSLIYRRLLAERYVE
ncbi:E3 ubiquitin-protein ligase RNF170 [Galendromus occidentalis]|uniref:E3 ubiquitin-protein ligase RNF170 n=1 Tax=Galendromus occidentalis TaxID=34638 RepID=A0AAJ6QW48_9ACAR|nr:E3 ubiquitin-protein ligase RNF170 [Galendromus occidentalis]